MSRLTTGPNASSSGGRRVAGRPCHRSAGAACRRCYPTWLLPEPLALPVRQRNATSTADRCAGLARLYRVKPAGGKAAFGAARLLHCPQSAGRAGVGVPRAAAPGAALRSRFRWYLRGLYA